MEIFRIKSVPFWERFFVVQNKRAKPAPDGGGCKVRKPKIEKWLTIFLSIWLTFLKKYDII